MSIEEDEEKVLYRRAYYGLIMCLFGATMFFYFPDFMEYVIQQNLKLSKGSTITEKWANPPVDIFVKFYLFNVTNFKLVRTGKPPNLQEVGPFIVRLEMKKEILNWHEENDTVTYKSITKFFSEEALSQNGGNDTIWIVNLPVVGMVSLLQETFPFATTSIPASIINGQLKTYKERLMKKLTVKEFLVEGLKVKFLEPLIGLLKTFVNLENMLKDNKIGILHMLNNTEPPFIVAHTGAKKPHAMGELITVKAKTGTEIWRDKYCSMVNGTEGPNFRHPVIERHQYFFLAPFCRSLKLDYAGNSEINGIPTKKFVFKSMFTSGKYNPSNRCFCRGRNRYCFLNGTFPLGPCMMGLPITVSQAHFYEADPYYLQQVTGLNPLQEKHESYFHIHPMLAMPLQVRVCLQFNLKVINHPNFPILANISNLMLPVAWVNLEIGIMNSGKEDLVYYLFVGLPFAAKVISGILMGFGGIRIGKLVLHSVKNKNRINDSSSAKVYPLDIQPSEMNDDTIKVEKF